MQYAEAICRVLGRCDRREDIFVGVVDRPDFQQQMIELMAGKLGENDTAPVHRRCIGP